MKSNKKEKGITLIALVVTIVVLLILATVSIQMLGGENGIITQASKAKEETRGASVEEARDLWKVNQNADGYSASKTSQTLKELINDLVANGQLTEDEKDQILGNEEKGVKATGKVTIGSRTIVFEEILELASYIDVTTDGVYIVVNFKYNNYGLYAKEILDGKSEEEIEQIFVEAENYYNLQLNWGHPMFNNINELIEYMSGNYDNGEYSTIDEMCYYYGYDNLYNLAIGSQHVEPKKWKENYTEINGIITTPDGNTTQVSRENNLKYKVAEDGTYKFTGVASDGRIAELEITTNLSNEYKLVPTFTKGDYITTIGLIKGYGEFIDILSEYNPKIKNLETGVALDATPGIFGIIEIGNINNIDDILQDKSEFYGEIAMTINGQTITLKGTFGPNPL